MDEVFDCEIYKFFLQWPHGIGMKNNRLRKKNRLQK